MPEENSRPQNSLVTVILVGLLIVASFFVGSLYTKVQMLEKGSAGTNAQAANNPPPADQQVTAPSAGDIPPVTDSDHVKGSKDAQIVMIEYSDFECPFCTRFHPTMKQVVQEYGDKVAWVYRHYPFPMHTNAQKAAEASECAAELGGKDAFWKYTDALYEKNETGDASALTVASLKSLAESQGLNGTKFQECLDSGKHGKKVKDDMDGGSKAGVTGTPGTLILTKDGKIDLIPGALPFEQVKAMLDKYVK